MKTSSNGIIFRVTGFLCGECTGELPTQRPVTRSFDVFFDLRLNKRVSKQSWDWWFKMPSRPLWRQCNVKSLEFSGAAEIRIVCNIYHQQPWYWLRTIIGFLIPYDERFIYLSHLSVTKWLKMHLYAFQKYTNDIKKLRYQWWQQITRSIK